MAPGLCVGAKAVLEVEATTCVERNDPASEAVAASVAGGRGVVSGCAAAEGQQPATVCEIEGNIGCG